MSVGVKFFVWIAGVKNVLPYSSLSLTPSCPFSGKMNTTFFNLCMQVQTSVLIIKSTLCMGKKHFNEILLQYRLL